MWRSPRNRSTCRAPWKEMLWVYRRGLSRDTVGSIATALLVGPAVSSRCLWLNQTQYGGAKRDCTGCHSIHRVPLRFKWVSKWKEAQSIIITIVSGRRRKPSGFKGAHMWPGCRYSLSSSCIPVRSHHTDMFPVNQTHSNSESVASTEAPPRGAALARFPPSAVDSKAWERNPVFIFTPFYIVTQRTHAASTSWFRFVFFLFCFVLSVSGVSQWKESIYIHKEYDFPLLYKCQGQK